MVFRAEFKKTVTAPAIIGFVLLSVILNAAVILSHSKPWESEQASSETVDIFDGFEAAGLSDRYIQKYNLSGTNADNVRALYTKLQPVIEQKAMNDDALSPYLGKNTTYLHGILFGMVFPLMIAEGCLLALFAALLSTGYENIHNTEPIVYASRTGRRILYPKLFAALSTGTALTVLILFVTLSLFFIRFDFAGVWNDKVSSFYNNAVNEYGKPFITWTSLTVSQYLWATAGAATGLSLCFGLLGFAVGTSFRNAYLSCVSAVTVCGVLFAVMPLLPIGSWSRGILNMTPVWLWLNSGQWFTDGGAGIIVENFECLGLMGSLAVLTAFSAVSTHIFKRRNLV